MKNTRYTDVAKAIAALNTPYDPVEIVKNLLDYAVYDTARNDECAEAVADAIAYLVQETGQ